MPYIRETTIAEQVTRLANLQWDRPKTPLSHKRYTALYNIVRDQTSTPRLLMPILREIPELQDCLAALMHSRKNDNKFHSAIMMKRIREIAEEAISTLNLPKVVDE